MNKEIEVLQGVCDGIAKNQYAGRFGTMGIHDCPACKRKWCKGLWAKIPAEGTTTVTKPTLQGQDDKGKNIWQDVKTQVPNTELKAMVTAEEYIFNDKYLKDYIEPGRGCYSEQRYIGAERVKELISEQWQDFQQCKVGYAGNGYNYCFWPDDELYNNKYQ